MSTRRKFIDIYVEPTHTLETIQLNDTSWVKVGIVEDGLTMHEFEQLWTEEKPLQRATIKIRGNTIECPRYTKNYLVPYTFSGQIHRTADENVPGVLDKILLRSKAMNPKLNQCLVNFYEADGSIGKHCDDEKQIVRYSEIHSWTFGPATRYFVLEPKVGLKRFKIAVKHNTLLIMGGHCQETHYHQVLKKSIDRENKNSNDENERRINVTFREMYID